MRNLLRRLYCWVFGHDYDYTWSGGVRDINAVAHSFGAYIGCRQCPWTSREPYFAGKLGNDNNPALCTSLLSKQPSWRQKPLELAEPNPVRTEDMDWVATQQVGKAILDERYTRKVLDAAEHVRDERVQATIAELDARPQTDF